MAAPARCDTYCALLRHAPSANSTPLTRLARRWMGCAKYRAPTVSLSASRPPADRASAWMASAGVITCRRPMARPTASSTDAASVSVASRTSAATCSRVTTLSGRLPPLVPAPCCPPAADPGDGVTRAAAAAAAAAAAPAALARARSASANAPATAACTVRSMVLVSAADMRSAITAICFSTLPASISTVVVAPFPASPLLLSLSLLPPPFRPPAAAGLLPVDFVTTCAAPLLPSARPTMVAAGLLDSASVSMYSVTATAPPPSTSALRDMPPPPPPAGRATYTLGGASPIASASYSYVTM